MSQPINPGTQVDHIQADPAARVETAHVVPVADAAGSLNNTYFVLPGGLYYVWFNVAAGGVDPAPGGTGIEVDIGTGATKADVAAAVIAAVNTDAHFHANLYGADEIEIRDLSGGTATDIAAGTSGFTVSTLVQGQAAGPVGSNPGDSPNGISNNPAAI